MIWIDELIENRFLILNPVTIFNYHCNITVKIVFLVKYPTIASDHLAEAGETGEAGEAEAEAADGK